MDIVKIARTTLSIWFAQAIPFTLIALALLAPSTGVDLLESWLGEQHDVAKALARVSSFLMSLGQNITIGIIAYSTFHALKGERISLGESASHVRGSLGAIVIAGVLYNLISGFGLLLCIIPGIIAMLAFYVVVPVVVVEQLNGQEALQRSSDLTRERRGEILGAVMLLLGPLFCIVLMAVLGIAIGVELVVDTEVNTHLERFTSMGMDVVVWILIAPLISISAVLCSVIYAELRQQRDDLGIDDLLHVFD